MATEYTLTWLDLDEFKARIGVTGSSDNDTLTQILAGVEAAVARYLGGPVLAGDPDLDPPDDPIIEIKPAFAMEQVICNQRPVRSIEGVWLDLDNTQTWDSTTLLDEDTYRLRTDYTTTAGNLVSKCGIIDSINGPVGARWYRYSAGRLAPTVRETLPFTVRISYYAGWAVAADLTELPADFYAAAYAEASYLWQARKFGSPYVTQSGSLNGASYSQGQLAMPAVGNFGQMRFPQLMTTIAISYLNAYRDLGASIGDGIV